MHIRKAHLAWVAVAALAAVTAGCAGRASPLSVNANHVRDSSAPRHTIAALAQDRPVLARHAMVVTSQHLATEVGLHILKEGGNAVDAAVAVGYALAVVHPCCGNIGGGGFMIIHLASGHNI
ncbi:Gamma-glutamyltranspeptidase, partial [mine drainage metagenome]